MMKRQAIDVGGINVVVERLHDTIKVLGYEPLVNNGTPGYVTCADAQVIKNAHPKCSVFDYQGSEYRLRG